MINTLAIGSVPKTRRTSMSRQCRLSAVAALTLALAGCRNAPAQRASAGEDARPAAASPRAEASMPQQIADVMVQLAGGIHPGFRFTHAKGLVLTGTFQPSPSAHSVSSAAHLRAGVRVTVRLSDGTGNPQISDVNPATSPRG